MPPADPGRDRPTLFCLHFLGGSARAWAAVASRLEPVLRCRAIDLPGFGDACGAIGYTVAEMADAVAAAISAEAPERWLLAGHSMGAKVAAVLARRSEDGAAGLGGLAGLMLLAGSPPGPEPIEQSRRQAMLGWFAGDAAASRGEAEQFIDAAGALLDAELREAVVSEVLRAAPAAWRAWLEFGSREDWSAEIGVLLTPTLLIAGADDADLGAAAQRRLMAPHFAAATLVTLPDAAHLLLLERPDAVAALIAAHAAAHFAALAVPPAPPISHAYRALIGSDRVSEKTRALLLERARPDDPEYRPQAMLAAEFAILRAVLSRVLPQTAPSIDLAARIDAELGGGGDGWRFDLLPPDQEAYRAALATLDAAAVARHGRSFTALGDAARDGLLADVASARLSGAAGPLDAAQMQAWFEDLRAAAVRHYVAHPATLARIGYGGIGYGGDGEPKPGFAAVGLGLREPWEPIAEAGRR